MNIKNEIKTAGQPNSQLLSNSSCNLRVLMQRAYAASWDDYCYYLLNEF